MHTHTSERGIALLITLLVMTVLLGVSASLLNITVKQLQFASIGLASETSFQAANAGMECMLYHDYEGYPPTTAAPGKFDIGQTSPNISCMGVNSNGSAGTIATEEEQVYEFSWDDTSVTNTPSVCTRVSIYKYYSDTVEPEMATALRRTPSAATKCAIGVSCTIIQSRGYNVACPTPGNTFPPRSIERELTQRY